MSNLGTYVPFISGYVYDNYGPRVATFVGAVLHTGGYLLIWSGYSKAQVAEGASFSLKFFPYCIYFFIVGHAAGWLDCSSLATSIRNFPEHRGFIVGVLKSFYGIGAGVIAQASYLYLKGNTGGLLLLLGAGLGLLLFLCIIFASLLPAHALVNSPAEVALTTNRLKWACVLMGSLAVVLSMTSVLGSHLNPHPLSPLARQLLFAAICFLLALTFLLPLSARPLRVRASGVSYTTITDFETTTKSYQVEQVELNTLQCFQNLNFWLLFGSCLAVQAGGLTCINNIAQIVQSLGGQKGDQDVYVSLTSVANAVGRLLAGVFSDYIANRLHRTQLLPFLVLAMGGVYAVMLWVDLKLLYLLCFLIGLCYGALWCLMPAIVSELFGVRHFGANYSSLSLAPASASFFFSTFLASRVYEAHAETPGGACLGRACFFSTFVAIACAHLLALFCSLLLARRTRVYYEGRKVAIEPACDVNASDSSSLARGYNSFIVVSSQT